MFAFHEVRFIQSVVFFLFSFTQFLLSTLATFCRDLFVRDITPSVNHDNLPSLGIFAARLVTPDETQKLSVLLNCLFFGSHNTFRH